MTEDQRNALLLTTEMSHLKKGEIVYFPGDPADYAYLLKEGHIRVSRITLEGKTITLDILDPGNIFGEMALTGQETRSEIAEALTDALICTFPRQILKQIIESSPEMAFQVTKIIGLRRLEIENKIENLIFSTVPVRLARLILALAERYPAKNPEGKRYIDLPLTHQDIAQLVGANRETTTTLLNRFKEENSISFHRHMIVLEDESQLHHLAGNG